MTTPSFENVAVMGAGAVGCYFGAMLARAGAQVRLIGRPALVDAVARDGLRFEGIDFKGRIAVSATADAAGVAGAGLVLFSVKSPDTETAARAITPHLAPGAVVLSLQNGVDNVERLRAQIANLVVPAVVYVAAEIPAPGVIRHNGRGDLVIAGERHPAGPALEVPGEQPGVLSEVARGVGVQQLADSPKSLAPRRWPSEGIVLEIETLAHEGFGARGSGYCGLDPVTGIGGNRHQDDNGNEDDGAKQHGFPLDRHAVRPVEPARSARGTSRQTRQ